MTDTEERPSEPAGVVPAANQPRPHRWQIGIRTLILLVAAIAVWLTYFVNRQHNAALDARIKTMVPLAHELIIDDPKKIAVVKLEEYWFDDNRWEVHLPEGQYRLCLATRGIDQAKLAPAGKRAAIAAGRQRIGLEQRRAGDEWQIRVLWDESELIAVTEPKDWYPETGSSSSADFSQSTQLSPESPVVLIRKRFMRRNNQGPYTDTTEGILLWIERVEEARGGP
jgi:hypothetical protein